MEQRKRLSDLLDSFTQNVEKLTVEDVKKNEADQKTVSVPELTIEDLMRENRLLRTRLALLGVPPDRQIESPRERKGQKATDDIRSLPVNEEKTVPSSTHSHSSSPNPSTNVTNPASNATRPNHFEYHEDLDDLFTLPPVPKFKRMDHGNEKRFMMAFFTWMFNFFFKFYHIEDTQNVNESGSRKFTFNRGRPDISVFLKDALRVASNTKYKEDSDDLVRFRCFPWDYVTAIECKKDMNDTTHCYQICQYLRNILLASPGRTFIIGALVDSAHVRIFKVSRDNDDTLEADVLHTYSELLDLEYIIALLRASPDVLGYTSNIIYPLGDWRISGCLGQSVNYVAHVTSTVGRARRAAKIFHSNQDAMNEIIVWEKLKDVYKERRVRGFPLIERSAFGNVIFMPEFLKATFDDGDQSWLQVWESLKLLHAAGYVHGDVRMDNIMKLGKGARAKLGVMDFGYSVGIGEKSKVGAFPTSSYNSATGQAVYPVDDAISLLKCRYCYGSKVKSISGPAYEVKWAKFQRKEPKTPLEQGICKLDFETKNGRRFSDHLLDIIVCRLLTIDQDTEIDFELLFAVNIN